MPTNSIRTELTISGTESYKKRLSEINASLKGLGSEMARVDAQYGKGAKSADALAAKQDILTRKVELQRKKLDETRKKYDEVVAAQGENSTAARKLATDYNYMAAQVETTEKAIEDNARALAEANSKYAQFSGRLKEAGLTADKLGESMDKLGRRVALAAGGAAVSVIGASVKGWMALEDEMANVGTIADTDVKSLDVLTREIVAASDAAHVEAVELARAQYQAISANIATADSAALVEKAAKAAKAGVSDVTTVIDGATSIINAWGIETKDTTSVFDRLLKTQQLGKTTIGELSKGIGQLTGLAPQLNVSLDETLAAVAALTQNGVQTSAAMTGLRAVLAGVLKPTSEAAEEAKRLGLEFSAAALKGKGLTGFLADVMDKTDGSEEALAKLFGSVEGLSQVMLLGGNAAGTYAGVLDELAGSAGTLDEMFAKRTSSSAEQFAGSLNRIQNAGVRLGQSFAPMINMAAGGVERLADALSGMSIEQQQSLVSNALWVAGIGGAVSVTGKLIRALPALKAGFSAVGALLGPAGPVVGGIALATAAVAGLATLIRQDARLELNVDQSRLEQFRAADRVLEDPLTITANAKLQIKTDIAQIGKELTRWLNDGVPETPEEQARMADGVTAAVGEAFNSIQEYYKERKEALAKELAGGLITQADYDASMLDLASKTDDLTQTLQTNADAVTAYIKELVAQNRAMTDEEIAELNKLLAALGATSDKVVEATNAKQAAYEAAYKRTAAGVGSDEDFALAMDWVELQYGNKRSAIESAKAATRGAYAPRYQGVTDEAEIRTIAAEENAALARLDERLAALEQERRSGYAGLAQGVATNAGIDLGLQQQYINYKAQYGGGVMGLLGNAMDWYQGVMRTPTQKSLMLQRAENNLESADSTQAVALLERAGVLDPGKAAEALDVAKALIDLVGSAPTAKIDTFSAEAAAEAVRELTEVAQDTEELDAVPGEYAAVGANAGDALANALESKTTVVQKASAKLGMTAVNAIRAALDIHSPSRKFAEVGVYSADGLIQGLNSRLEAVGRAAGGVAQAAVGGAAQRAVSTARAAQPASPTIVQEIKYTAGAGSRREARMLGNRLAQEQRKALAAEGL